MLFRRKIYDKFLTWKKETGGKKALLVEGARRIGKSTVVEEFAKNEYRSYILIDFARATETVKEYFLEHLNDLDTFFMLLSVEYGVTLYPRESIIVFDEVQMFPKAREAIKYLVADGRYDYIETGSLISIKENVKDMLHRHPRVRTEIFYGGSGEARGGYCALQGQDPDDPASRQAETAASGLCRKTENPLRRDLSHGARKTSGPESHMGADERAV